MKHSLRWYQRRRYAILGKLKARYYLQQKQLVWYGTKQSRDVTTKMCPQHSSKCCKILVTGMQRVLPNGLTTVPDNWRIGHSIVQWWLRWTEIVFRWSLSNILRKDILLCLLTLSMHLLNGIWDRRKNWWTSMILWNVCRRVVKPWKWIPMNFSTSKRN